MPKDKLSPRPIKSYYLCSSGVIKFDYIVRVEGSGESARVIYKDGWNPAASCFLTKEQCRRFHRLPTEGFFKANAKLVAQLERLLESARRLPAQ